MITDNPSDRIAPGPGTEISEVGPGMASLENSPESRSERNPSGRGFFYRSMLESIQDGLSVLDEDLTIVFTNSVIEKWYSHQLPLVGKKCYQVYHGRREPCEVCPSRRTLLDRRDHREIVPWIGAGGALKGWLEIFSFPWRGPWGGGLNGVMEYVRDVTEHYKLQSQLKESEEKYRMVVENANEGIFICQNGRAEFFNRQALEMLGVGMVEMADLGVETFIHPEDRTLFLDRIARRLDGQELPPTVTFRVINRAGDVSWVEANDGLFQWNGTSATIHFFRDITTQKKWEAEYFQAQKMEAIGTLAGGIAHDFNNLLMGLQGNASLMLLDLDPSHPFYPRLKNMEAIVQSGAELTRQLLGFARRGRYEVRPTDLNDLLRKTSELFGRTRKEIRTRHHLAEGLWTVEADRGQVEQALLNLFINAWQAMPKGGELNLQTENITLDENYIRPFKINPGDYVKISITDTGVGMDEETRKRIFEPFFTTKEMGRGTGLGLASVYGIVKNHGGLINVYSELKRGTTFTLYFPALKAGLPEEKKSPGPLLTGRETVLLVDDEEVILEVGEAMLGNLGYRVITAGSGEEALRLYQDPSQAFDLVILDMILPEMDGGEIFDRIKEINPEVKVLLSSGYSLNSQASRIMMRGCRGFIQKPFSIQELSLKVRGGIEPGRRNQGT